jgi:hypothetical protein
MQRNCSQPDIKSSNESRGVRLTKKSRGHNQGTAGHSTRSTNIKERSSRRTTLSHATCGMQSGLMITPSPIHEI